MEYTFVNTDAEGYSLYVAVIFYIAAITIVLTRYLNIIRDKKLNPKMVRLKKRKVYILAVVSLVICVIIHTILFFVFFKLIPIESTLEIPIRVSYYMTIIITLIVFMTFMGFGFYLKGTSTLPKHQGPVTGV